MKPLLCLAALALLNGCALPPAPVTESPPTEHLRIVREDWQTQRQREQEAEAARRQRYTDERPALKPEIRDAILKGEVLIGMTAADVTASWGEPERRTRTQYATGSSDVWTHGSTHLVFQNGVLTSWTETRVK